MSWLFPKAQKEHELFRDVHSNIDGNYYSIYENTGDAISKLKDAATELSGIIENSSDLDGKESLEAIFEIINACTGNLENARTNIEYVKQQMHFMDEATWRNCES